MLDDFAGCRFAVMKDTYVARFMKCGRKLDFLMLNGMMLCAARWAQLIGYLRRFDFPGQGSSPSSSRRP